jgi:hypothetical protein
MAVSTLRTCEDQGPYLVDVELGCNFLANRLGPRGQRHIDEVWPDKVAAAFGLKFVEPCRQKQEPTQLLWATLARNA